MKKIICGIQKFLDFIVMPEFSTVWRRRSLAVLNMWHPAFWIPDIKCVYARKLAGTLNSGMTYKFLKFPHQKKKIFLNFITAMLLLLCCITSIAATHKNLNIMDKARHTKNLSKFVRLIRAADLTDTLKEAGPFTIFAPTNEAFAKLPKGTLQQLFDNKKQLIALLTYHVVPGKISFSELKDGSIKTAEGQDIVIKKEGRAILVNNANIVQGNINASNGMIHEIDTLLIPPAQQPTK